MKRLVAMITALALMAFMACQVSLAGYSDLPDPGVLAAAAILADAKTGELLFEKNIHARRMPASLTKMMTCILALEHAESAGCMDDIVTVTDDETATAVLSLIDPKGKVVDCESCKTGFRRIEVVNNVIELNGERMIFRGVNRHEHAYKTGRYVSEEHMRQEVILMKQLNFNGVRTCHYPDDPTWYDLCDEYGLCLVCEANLETHGVSGVLSKDPAWSGAYLERAVRMVLIHKNHPSVVSWSLGNESPWGANHAAMANWIRQYDPQPSRLVQYEAGTPGPVISDLRGRMYSSPETIREMLGDERDLRPIVLVEYLYQICNAGGGMHHFVELTEKYRRFQGGFVWDWQDKCLPARGRADLQSAFDNGRADLQSAGNTRIKNPRSH